MTSIKRNKRIVRKQVFETNSSSAHSITITNYPTINDYYLEGEIKIHINKYEDWHWHGSSLNYYKDKLRYALSALNDFGYDEKIIKVFELFKERYPDLKMFIFISSNEEEIYINLEDLSYTTINNLMRFIKEFESTVDHSSTEVIASLNPKEIFSIIVNDDAKIHIDNDNNEWMDNLIRFKEPQLLEILKKEGIEDLDDLDYFYSNEMLKMLEEKYEIKIFY